MLRSSKNITRKISKLIYNINTKKITKILTIYLPKKVQKVPHQNTFVNVEKLININKAYLIIKKNVLL